MSVGNSDSQLHHSCQLLTKYWLFFNRSIISKMTTHTHIRELELDHNAWLKTYWAIREGDDFWMGVYWKHHLVTVRGVLQFNGSLIVCLNLEPVRDNTTYNFNPLLMQLAIYSCSSDIVCSMEHKSFFFTGSWPLSRVFALASSDIQKQTVRCWEHLQYFLA